MVTCQSCGRRISVDDIVRTVEIVDGKVQERHEIQCPGCAATDTVAKLVDE